MRTNWRGPFRVKRDGPSRAAWKIVNRHGETERMGYRAKADADQICRLMNQAKELRNEP
jgi:hypothetical protein